MLYGVVGPDLKGNWLDLRQMQSSSQFNSVDR